MKYSKGIQYISTLPEHLKDSLEWYTGGGFDKLNERLRKNLNLSELKEKLKEISRIIMYNSDTPYSVKVNTIFRRHINTLGQPEDITVKTANDN